MAEAHGRGGRGSNAGRGLGSGRSRRSCGSGGRTSRDGDFFWDGSLILDPLLIHNPQWYRAVPHSDRFHTQDFRVYLKLKLHSFCAQKHLFPRIMYRHHLPPR